MLRVAVIGQDAFGAAVLERLLADGVPVTAVSAPHTSGGPADPLWAAGEAAGVPVVATASLRADDGVAHWRETEPDLCVMAFVTTFLPQEVLAVPAHGTIQYHPSLLPAHRGPSAMNWPIIHGETETGFTVFWPDEGIDTGAVLLQRSCPIRPDETVASLYFEHLFPRGVDALAEAVALVAAGEAPRVPQEHALGTYEPACTEAHGEIRWYEPAQRVYARIRGCNPQPGAWTRFGEERLGIFDCQLLGQSAPGMPGRVLAVDEDGFTVRLNGDVLRVRRVQPAGAKKMPAAQWATQVDLTEGFRFR